MNYKKDKSGNPVPWSSQQRDKKPKSKSKNYPTNVADGHRMKSKGRKP